MQTMNKLPCGQCAFYDAASMARPGRPTRMGWCAANSVYPSTDEAGRTAPRGVTRADPGDLPKPLIVTREQVMPGCTKAAPATAPKAVTRDNLLAKARGR